MKIQFLNLPIKHGLYLLYLLLFMVKVNANQRIEMVTGLPKPPFVVDNNQGMQLDIIRAALALQDVNVKFINMPFGRNIYSFSRFGYDGVITVLSNTERDDMFVSAPYIRYQNVAVSLSENKFTIEEFNDLENKSIVAFQRAKIYLGEQYNQAIDKAKSYREVAEQQQQLSALYLKHADVIVLDVNIFKYYHNQYKEAHAVAPYTAHAFFKANNYAAGFRNKAIKDKFDAGIKILKENGQYQKIIDSYIN